MRINFCFSRKEQLAKLMPALCDPSRFPLIELDLAANGLSDSDACDLLAKIILCHQEYRDEIYWRYALRNEVPPRDEV